MVCEQSFIKVLKASLWAKQANLAEGTLMKLCLQTMPKAWYKNLWNYDLLGGGTKLLKYA
jgi:hypothetical protein